MTVTAQRTLLRAALVLGLCLGAGLLISTPATAHCDGLDGPVVKAARAALAAGDVTPVLKWVRKDEETAIRGAFKRTLVVRGKGPEAKELADRFFFETLVRVHRAGEGAPYTGLKPAGTDPGPAVTAADRALESGRADALMKQVTEDVVAGIRRRFARVVEAKRHAEHNVEAGRAFVEAYVDFVHHVERLHGVAAASAGSHGEAAGSGQTDHRH